MVHDLQIERRAVGVAQGRQRHHRVVGRGEDRVEQIILRAALVDIGADQCRAPARGGRQCQHIVGPDHAVAHAMGAGLVRLSVLERACHRFRQRGGAIRRQLGDRNVPTLLAQPFLHVAPAAREFERASPLSNAIWSASRPSCRASRPHSAAAGHPASTPHAICAEAPGCRQTFRWPVCPASSSRHSLQSPTHFPRASKCPPA